MSDRKNRIRPGEAWVPLDISLLESFGEEHLQQSERTALDFDLFKVLYEAPAFREEDRFRELYDPEVSDAPVAILTASGPSGTGAGKEAGSSQTEEPGTEQAILSEKERGFEAGLEAGRTQGHGLGLEQGRKQGYDDGFKKGEAEARARVEKQSKAIISSLETMLTTLESNWDRLIREDEDRILKLICQISEKVVLATVVLDQDVVRRSVLKALSSLPEPEEIILNISPEDYEYIETIKEEFFDTVKSLTRISVVSNASVTRGGCVVESSDARVKTDIQSRLEAVFQSILGKGDA